jgi:hypothetical protein
MTTQHNLFLSYSYKDSNVAAELRDEFESEGISCFMAKVDIAAGIEWEREIRKNIRQADTVVLLITPNSINSTWIAIEAGAAWVSGIPLIAATIYVSADELTTPLTMRQHRAIETCHRRKELAKELAKASQFPDNDISGRWRDDNRYTIFFKQTNDKIIGYYDMGEEEKKGMYIGTVHGRAIEFTWKRLKESNRGIGTMLMESARRLLIDLRRVEPEPKQELLRFYREGDDMPSWLKPDDFSKLQG